MELHTKRLILKPFCEGDEATVLRIITDERVAKTFMVPEIHSAEEGRKVFDALLKLSNTEGQYLLGIFLKDTLLGFINDVDISGKSVELGWAVHPDFQGRGYATEAAEALINKLFSDGFEEIRAGAFEGNEASFRVMEKLGMRRISFEESIDYRGEKHRCIYYAIKK